MTGAPNKESQSDSWTAPSDGVAIAGRSLDRQRLRRTVVGSAIGNMMEQYDFAVYGAMAALIIGPLFFSGLGADAALFASFSTAAVGFFARPLGGMVAGHFGDIYGRKNVLIASFLGAGVVTVLIGLLPTYATAGIWAPILLVSLRLIQGLALGGEYSGAALMINETAPPKRRGVFTSIVAASGVLGIIIANLVVLTFTLMPDDAFNSWGWRIPFLLACLLVIIGLTLRVRLLETVEFEAIKEIDSTVTDKHRWPVLEAIKENPRGVLTLTGMAFGVGSLFFIMVTWMLSYLTKNIGLHRSTALLIILVASIVYLFVTVGTAALSDVVGRRPVMIAGAAMFIISAFPFFVLLKTGSTLIVLAALMMAFFFIGMTGPFAAIMCELFNPRHRYSGASMGYQIGTGLGGGLSPLIATSLMTASHGATWAISLYIMLLGALIAICALAMPETAWIKTQPSKSAAIMDRLDRSRS